MSTQAPFALRRRNPDVLTCIANLSNDEVFTPPTFANQMLDTLAEAWAAGHLDRTLRHPRQRGVDRQVEGADDSGSGYECSG
ncbi:hypothetical protein Mterra_01506 [Calidithermus terrae]|uniref:Uncharacterized protein n=1 Tax=Calidithermus terrae TaxID=1408545 RepID=A0A399EQL5_9DEIN|nr:hypothetical protein [Calidithermus terrae]RIH86155.1 hypothetical protein Mterra_01506 [Calidithermus terrae]